MYETHKGEILTEEEYSKAKASSLEYYKKESGADIELYETLEISAETNNKIIYTFKWEFVDKETYAEKLREEKLIGKTFADFDSLIFLNPEDRNKIDKNKPTLVNIWFESCSPCKGELPALNLFEEKYHDKITFVSITFESKEKVEKFLKKNTFNFTHIEDTKELLIALGITSFPKTFMLDKNRIIKSIEGTIPPMKYEMYYNIQMKIMEKAIEKLL